MNSNPESPSADSTNNFLKRLQDESRAWELDGKDAWSALLRLGSKPLPPGDEVVLGKRLHAELPRLKSELKKQGVGLGDFCLRAGLGVEGQYSKELHRMILPPDRDPAEVRLRRSAMKYRRLLSEMARVLNQSRSALANRLMLGTSLHPATAVIRDEVDQIQSMLQTVVDAVDAEFRLFQTFMETAALKAEHAGAGGGCRWPQYEAEYRAWQFAPADQDEGNAIDLEHWQEPIASVSAFAAEREAAMDISRAFWQEAPTKRNKSYESWTWGPTSSGCLQDDEFFYVPHAYLGYGDGLCNMVDSKLTPIERDSAVAGLRESALRDFEKYGPAPVDGWDEVTQKPSGQTSSMGDAHANYHAWLVAYPSPDNTRLMPMLLMPVEECGPILVPLDAVTLLGLRNAYWVGTDGQTSTFLERIKSLIGYQPGHPAAILEGLRRTAPWLRYNPFMKMTRQKSTEMELMQEFCKGLLQQAGNLKDCQE